MRLRNISEIEDFKSAIDKCKGQVYIQSNDGTRLNLKSVMSMYVSIGNLIQERGSDFELFCDLKNDEQHFFRFFMDHPEVNQ